MRPPRLAWLLPLALLLVAPAGRPRAAAAESAASRWEAIDAAARDAIAQGGMPGVAVLVGHEGKVVYRKAFGDRSVRPERQPMTTDTVFDLASLTKVVATTSAVMSLMEEGKIRPQDPVVRHWPEFGQNGKEKVTVRQLLTHSSGLPAWANYYARFGDPRVYGIQSHKAEILGAIAAMPLANPSESRFVYSDLGFITLGHLVERISGEPLDTFVRKRIFEPLGMKETTYNPGPELQARCAPTTERAGRFLLGSVHDENSSMCMGVAGHAGLFSTVDDLAKFARMLLSSDGKRGGAYPLNPATVRVMTSPQSPRGLPVRGFGWDIDSPYSHVRGDLFPVGSFGHTGFTGTYIWVDPYSDTFVIGLSNRVHPDGKGNPLPFWAKLANIVSGIVRPQELPARPPVVVPRAAVLTGIDVLQRDGFKLLQGRKVGLVTNRTGVNRERKSTIDLLREAPGVQLVALFSPEHGLRAELDAPVASSVDEKTGLPIHSLYGGEGKNKPTAAQLQGIDTLVYDIQDVGVRYYTYISTLALCMEAAAENKLRMVVLDRPNPIGGVVVDGPLLDPDQKSFVGYHRLPVRHGMTVGELAKLYNEEFGTRCDLTVVQMDNYRRNLWFDQTGVPWVDPSPNMRNTEEAELYCGIGLIEYANVSVGRGTDTPFERFGAPWIDGNRLAIELNRRGLPGVAFVPISYRPASSIHQGQVCGGVEVRMLDRRVFQGCRTAIEILDALVALYPKDVKIERCARLFGTAKIPQDLLARRPVAEIVADYQDDVREFERLRGKYLLYR